MTAYAGVLDWAATRPWWQQQAIVKLASGAEYTDEDYAELVEALLKEPPEPPAAGWLDGIQQPPETSSPTVILRSIRDVRNVNRLTNGEILTFAPTGITVVFGTNGSGKSGYARLVKTLVRTRDHEQILPDIFSDAGGPQSACLEYAWGGEQKSVMLSEAAPAELQQISFYDERCGDLYVTKEGEARFRPSALGLLDGLIEVCDGVRQRLDVRTAANARGASQLPAVSAETEAGKFLLELSGATSDALLAAKCTIDDEAAQRLETTRAEALRLRATNPAREAARLERLAQAFEELSLHLNSLQSELGIEAEADLREKRHLARQARELADAAAAASSIEEPIDGVGSLEWRAMWSAAQRYSEKFAYQAHSFPHTAEGSVCVLCQQPLGEEARTRLRRFHEMMLDSTEAEAKSAAARSESRVHKLDAVTPMSAASAVSLSVLEPANPEVHAEVKSALDAWSRRLEALKAAVPAPPCPDAELAPRLRDASQRLSAEASLINPAAFDDTIFALEKDARELEAKMLLANSAEEIRAERDRRREYDLLAEARRQTDTRGISRALGDLTSTYVTIVVQDRFSRESQDLRVDSVTLLGKGVKHGSVLHRPEFVGASIRAELPQVPSEGEQTALGLSGFFVEAQLDASKSAIVLDDPVTSLDHLRRDVVADRLARFARDRQVVVFTHDMAFAASLKKRAASRGVIITERTIERSLADGQPGVVHLKHPWAIKDTKERLDQLGTEIARLKKRVAAGDLTGDAYDDAVSQWAGRLSQTWERIISQEIADYLLDRSTLHVSVTMLKIAERISREDNQELQESYGRCSGWTRHDQDVALNYVPPALDELEVELERVKAWHKRVVQYRK